MGHLVYASKAKIAQFRKDKIKIIGHTSESYFELNSKKDMMWTKLNFGLKMKELGMKRNHVYELPIYQVMCKININKQLI